MEKQERNRLADDYFSTLNDYSIGPQIEGVDPENYQQLIDDPTTINISVDGMELPLFGRLSYAEWINTEFFADRGIDESALYFCLLPQSYLMQHHDELGESIYGQFSETDGNFSVLIDFPDISGVKPIDEIVEIDSNVDRLITSVETPAATYHYRAKFSPKAQQLESFVTDESVYKIQDKEQIETYFDRIWDIYERQFKDLVDDHPINGAISRDDLKKTLLNEGSDLYVYIDDDGVLQSFGYIVRDFDLCPWLNKSYFENESEGLPVMYMPGIATAPESGISASTKIMEALLYNNLKEFGEWIVTFECSNISAQYVPMLVERATENAGIAEFSGLNETKHMYEVVEFSQSN